ncbi:helix-turn-helix transcriptional regulator [Microbacterium oxydans]|nr:helix-turn-helix transcriptional regulator [Microbacterium oxydans]
MVRALRQDSGLTQEMLAVRVGITKNQLQLIEAGRSASGKQDAGPSNPRMTTLVGIADAFGLSVEQLMAESRL